MIKLCLSLSTRGALDTESCRHIYHLPLPPVRPTSRYKLSDRTVAREAARGTTVVLPGRRSCLSLSWRQPEAGRQGLSEVFIHSKHLSDEGNSMTLCRTFGARVGRQSLDYIGQSRRRHQGNDRSFYLMFTVCQHARSRSGLFDPSRTGLPCTQSDVLVSITRPNGCRRLCIPVAWTCSAVMSSLDQSIGRRNPMCLSVKAAMAE